MRTGLVRRSSAATWELLSCGKVAVASEQFAPLTRASAASTPLAVAMFLIALTGLLAGWLSLATQPMAAILVALGAMTLLLYAGAALSKECSTLTNSGNSNPQRLRS